MTERIMSGDFGRPKWNVVGSCSCTGCESVSNVPTVHVTLRPPPGTGRIHAAGYQSTYQLLAIKPNDPQTDEEVF